ncbi:hypothetical protein [Natrinema gelatinilyticum]|uniref:hypothetical protein n=1 Tax=Natrinema gelatinilyticum TaxID=2961571 RepID=UPI0020C2D79D|nr:hypothetical protein [Natrinema gelatinilyticum]
MISSEGLKTWFDYELLFMALAISLLVGIWGINQLARYVASLPLTSPQFALAFTAIATGTIIFIIWLTGRITDQ